MCEVCEVFFANSEDHAWLRLLVTCHGKIAAEQICHFLHILVNKLNNLGLTTTLLLDSGLLN